MEDKMFNLLEKMYLEMQEMKVNMASKQDIVKIEQNIVKIEQNIVKIEDKIDTNHKALFDGYKQSIEKLDRIEKEVSKHEEIILRRIK